MNERLILKFIARIGKEHAKHENRRFMNCGRHMEFACYFKRTASELHIYLNPKIIFVLLKNYFLLFAKDFIAISTECR